MRIAVLGAPGTGKTGFASKLRMSLAKDKDISEILTPGFKIIDKYVDKLQKTTGFAFDIHSTYAQDMQILFHRWTLEQEAAHAGYHTITCGTLYETILWSSFRAISPAVKQDVEGTYRANSYMRTLGAIESDISDYDLLFFLPWSERMRSKAGRSYATVVNEKLPELVDGYYRELFSLVGTDKDKVKSATDIIREYITWQAEAALAEQSAESGSGESSQGQPQGE